MIPNDLSSNLINPPVEQKPKPHHLKPWLALGVILLAAAVVGSWAWSKGREHPLAPSLNKEGESGTPPFYWQTYRNEEYGFEFKFPGDLVEQDNNPLYDPATKQPLKFFTSNIKCEPTEGICVPRGMNLHVVSAADLQVWLKENFYKTVDEIQIAGKTTVVGIRTGTEAVQEYFLPVTDGNYLELDIWTSKTERDQILSTFKFFEPEIPDEIVDLGSGRHKYISQRYAFEIQYPSDWDYDVRDPAGEPIVEFSNKQSSVAVFPSGLGTEGPLGQIRVIDDDLTPEPEELEFEYLLADGQRWGVHISFSDAPLSFIGFIRAYTTVENLMIICDTNGKELSDQNTCEPRDKNSISLTGQIKKDEWGILYQILSTFKFIK